MKTELLW